MLLLCRSRIWQTMAHGVRMLALVWVIALLVMLPIPLVSRLSHESNFTNCAEHFPACALFLIIRIFCCLYSIFRIVVFESLLIRPCCLLLYTYPHKWAHCIPPKTKHISYIYKWRVDAVGVQCVARRVRVSASALLVGVQLRLDPSQTPWGHLHLCLREERLFWRTKCSHICFPERPPKALDADDVDKRALHRCGRSDQ